MEMPKTVQEILRALEQAGFEAWCVGGCVRDTLLGRVPGDWDVTTSALPEETMAVFGTAWTETITTIAVRIPSPSPAPLRRTCAAVTSPSTPWPWTSGGISAIPSVDVLI